MAIQKAIETAPERKAVGCDEVFNEALQLAPEAFASLLTAV